MTERESFTGMRPGSKLDDNAEDLDERRRARRCSELAYTYRPGQEVRVGDRQATVVCASFGTHVFGGHVSVRYGDGTLGLIEPGQLEKIKIT